MFSLIDIPHIHTLEVEPTTFCNAGCPYCSRHKPGTSDLIENLALEHIPVDIFPKIKKDFDLYQGSKEVNIWFCGNYGDSLMHPEFEYLYRYTSENFKNIGVHTNGGARPVSFWENLGKISAERKEHRWENGTTRITFSIDGLEDTNHLYRKKVDWNRLMANVEAFIGAGGWAEWKYLVFDHNKHQINEAKKLSEKLGFKSFRAEASSREDAEKTNKDEWEKAIKESKTMAKEKVKRVPNIDKIINKKGTEVKQKLDAKGTQDCISCRGIDDNRMYLNPKSRIWPCCYLSEEYDLSIHQLAQKEPWLVPHYKNGFNDFSKNSLREIFDAPAWKEITDSWITRKRELHRCWRSCKNGKWRFSGSVILN